MAGSETIFRGNIVITGAGSGIGETTALHLDRLGFRVFAGVRKAADGEALRQKASPRLTPLVLDVTDEATIQAAAQLVAAECGAAGLYGLINNAATTVAGPIEYIPLSELRRQFEVNVFGHIAVTQAFMPLIRQAQGRVINVSSAASLLVFPYFGGYAASKFALEALTDAMRRELYPWGIHAISVVPGRTRTPIFEKTVIAIEDAVKLMPPEALERYGEGMKRKAAGVMKGDGMKPAEVAAVISAALTDAKPKPRYLVGIRQKGLGILVRLAPDRFLDWLMLARRKARGGEVKVPEGGAVEAG